MPELDIGEPTGEAAQQSDAELDKTLAGADVTTLDAAFDQQHGAYLDDWAQAIRNRFAKTV